MTVLTIGLFWPNVNVSVSTLLSKILGPRRQANQQSLFQMSGSLARLIGPVLMSYIYTAHGIAYSWIFEICVLVFLISVWIILYNRIVPLKMPDPNQPIPAPLDDESASDFDENENTYSIARF
jgi:MFS family permease